ncbi:MAG TPA: response regulator [Candidatus Dormibacteraeota bacterium]|nr:response regulator [Candidatus Dormibacteraeota bacterium]
MPDQPLILVVEDREDDITVIRKSFERGQVSTALQIVKDGDEAILYLEGTGKFSNRAEYPLPWLVLLDLKMPRVSGFEVLKWIRRHPTLCSIVVLVLTSSDQVRDVNQAYALGANSFLVKPTDFENSVALATLIQQYWVQYNRFGENVRSERPKMNGGKKQ